MLSQFNFIDFNEFCRYCDQHLILDNLSQEQLESVYHSLHSFKPNFKTIPSSISISDFQYSL